MAARTRRIKHDDATRERIRTSQLLNRLHQCGLEDLELKNSQVKAIEILLRKSLPDLSNVEISGKGGGPIVLGWAAKDDDA